MKKNICFGIALLVFLFACRRPEKFPIIPEIKFISFEEFNDTEGLLVFYFQDGDGDIGLNPWDTIPPFEYNFFCDYYEKRYGIFVKIDSIVDYRGETIAFNHNGRIPILSRLPEESISGEIYYTISPWYYDFFSPYNDTIQLKFYIVDRKLHKSNVEEIVIIRK